MMYVIGYDKAGKFVTLYKSHNVRLTLAMAKKLQTMLEKETIKVKKRP